MITIEAGRAFCKAYNRKYGTNMSPEEIFREIVAPLEYGEGDGKKNLIIWGNSTFTPKGEKDILKKNPTNFKKELDSFCAKVKDRSGYMSLVNVYMGPAVVSENPNNANVTFRNYPFGLDYDDDDRFCSWIGSLFSFHVGNVDLSINNEDFIMDMFESVKMYRRFLDSNEDIKGNQVQTFNTHYLYYKYKINNINGLDRNNIVKNGGLKRSELTFMKFLVILAENYKNVKYLFPYLNGNYNTTYPPIIIDDGFLPALETCERDILERVSQASSVDRMNDNEDYEKTFEEIFGNGEIILENAEKFGWIKKEMLDPIECSKNSKSILFSKYIKIIMTEREIELCDNFVTAIKASKSDTNVWYQVDELLESKRVIKFMTTINGLIPKLRISEKDGSSIDDFVRYAILEPPNFPLMLEYCKYMSNKK